MFDERGITMRAIVIDEAQRTMTVGSPSSITNKSSARDQRMIQEAIQKKRMVATIAPERARTIYTTIALARQNEATAPIDEAAQEQMITASIWKLFETERGRIAAALDIPEGETIIVDVHIWEIAINGQTVMNPLTLEPGDVAVTLSATLMREGEWRVMQRAFGDAFTLVVESGVSLARQVGKAQSGDALIAIVDERRTKMYGKQGNWLGYRDGFPWGAGRLKEEVRAQCGVNAEIAEHVVHTYARQMGSSLFQETIERVMHGELQLLVHGIEHALGKKKPLKEKEAYVAARWQFPGMPGFIHQFSSGKASEELGVRIEWKCGDADIAFEEIMPVIDAYMAPQQREGNAIAKRYLRWRERS